MSADATPFACCSLASLKLLAGFLAFGAEAESVRPFVWRLAGSTATPPCVRLERIVAAARRPGSGHALDGILAAIASPDSARFEGRSVADLAALWSSERSTLAGPELAAFVWWMARDSRAAVRPLERKVADAIEWPRLIGEPGSTDVRAPRA